LSSSVASSPAPPSTGLPPIPDHVRLAPVGRRVDWRRNLFIALGLVLFLAVLLSPPWPAAVDPGGKTFALSPEAKASIALFVLALVWWVFEVVPIGVTAIVIGVTQALLRIRPPKVAFGDFMDPSVWFIIGSLVIGIVFTRTGLTKRMAYRILLLVGERTSLIYLGCFVMTAAMTHIMAHTAVAAAVFPLLMAIHSLYEEGEKPTRFGKGLFIGMAFVAGAGSIVTLLGSARAAVAIGFFKDMAGREISFFELTWYLFPVGWAMVFLVWGFCLLVFPPERRTISGLRERVLHLHSRLGPVSSDEILTLRILTLEDLEQVPWNIVLLFGGAMSIGLCLWQTGAASWLAVEWLALFKSAPWFVFVMGVGLFVLAMTNVIMNVAAIAICLPVALVIARYLGVAPEVIFYTSLVAAGMPFMLLIGAAPNAIAYGSGQFTSGEFFRAGVAASVLLMLVLGLFVWLVWPLMGMPIRLG
jgi:sodium-dependent dicarboxylate transporter 2/3/5